MDKQIKSDRNFDDLAPKFKRKIYGGLKGRIRLAILKKDLSEFIPAALLPAGETPLNILDAGSGYGPFSLPIAGLGHRLTLCDISLEMLKIAKANILEKKILTPVKIVHSSIQDLPEDTGCFYDLILCHAVLEWVHNPRDVIIHLLRLLKKEGILSLTFYNLNGMIYKNLLRTNFKRIKEKDYSGWPGSLTPTSPRHPSDVSAWLEAENVEVICHSGIRVFYDYILNPEDREREPETVLEMELNLSRKMPYRDLGRYQHMVVTKP